MRKTIAALVALATSFSSSPAQSWPGQQTNDVTRFDLPVRRDALGRLSTMLCMGLTVSWDGKLVMYQDDQWQSLVPQGAHNGWFVFAAFNPAEATVNPNGTVDFSACFGTPLPRFAGVNDNTAPGATTNNYPTATGYVGGAYPSLPNTMGELGLRYVWDVLSHNMHPAPEAELPAGANNHNPFRSTRQGVPQEGGPCLTYHAYVTFQDMPRYWNGSAWAPFTGGVFGGTQTVTGYWGANPPPTYPNGAQLWAPTTWPMKRNGIAKLEIIVDLSVDVPVPPVVAVNVLQKWQPFRVQYTGQATGLNIGLDVPSATEMWADNFEPSLTNDGHLMIGKGGRLVNGTWHSGVMFYYNTTAFAAGGWQGPWHLHHLYEHRNVVLGGRTIEERYPLSRQRLKAYDGALFADTDNDGTVTAQERDAHNFEGGYNWISPDGRYVVYSVYGGGVGSANASGLPALNIQPWGDHPQTVNPSFLVDGGGTSNRAQVSLIGSVTGWQQWRIDHPAANPGRHYFTAWDQESRTVFTRTGSFGFSPGFWEMLKHAPGLPYGKDGLPKLHLVNNNRLLFYEVDLSPYQERDYGFYLPMTEMLELYPNTAYSVIEHREVDLSRTPDLSAKGNVGYVVGAQLPCEYFELPEKIKGPTNSLDRYVVGLYRPAVASTPAAAATMIHLNWQAGDVIQGAPGEYWARLADWKDGTPINPPPSTSPRTAPYTGRGNLHDMDSDMCWGRVGQAMFFKNDTKVVVLNNGSKAELNPGTVGRSNGLTASFWIHPLQARSADVIVYRHNFAMWLMQSGHVTVLMLDAAANQYWISSSTTAPTGVWTHVTLTWRDTAVANQSELKLYLNGVSAAAPVTMNHDRLYASTFDVDIGCIGAVATNPNLAVFLLDEVALKNSAMEPEDVRHLALLPASAQPTWNNSNLPAAPSPFVNQDDARVPAANPYDANIAMLGADLFRDVQLSGQKQVSCATCHKPEQRFTDGQVKSFGQAGQTLRHTPTILNQRFETRQFWDSRADDLEDQALDPVLNSGEMANTWTNVLNYLSSDPDYSVRFPALFPGPNPISEQNVRRALATYMRAPTTGNSAADQGQFGPAELRGRGLFFGKARCSACHTGKNLTDGRLWNTGSVRNDGTDDGASRADSGRLTSERQRYFGSFKTPSLRDVAMTAPYFHDGHAATLADVVTFYDNGGVRTDSNGFTLQQSRHHFAAEEINRKLGLTTQERADLVAYLQTFTGTALALGPTGLNNAPTVVVLPPDDDTTTPTIVIDVTDPDANDIDPAMIWTLEVSIQGAPPVGWSAGTVTTITNGRRITIPSAVHTGSVRAADRHGRWSTLVAF